MLEDIQVYGCQEVWLLMTDGIDFSAKMLEWILEVLEVCCIRFLFLSAIGVKKISPVSGSIEALRWRQLTILPKSLQARSSFNERLGKRMELSKCTDVVTV